MSQSNLGSDFISKLKQIGINDCQNLDGSLIDWVFMLPENAPLNEFISWFCSNVSSAEVLSEEEVTRYGALEAAGEVLEGQQLENMSQCLVGIEGVISQGNEDTHNIIIRTDSDDENDEFDKEMEKLHIQMKRVNFRKNQLSMENIKISAQLADNSSELVQVQSRVLQQQAAALSASQELSDHFSKLSLINDKLAVLVKKIQMPETGYLLSTDLTGLREEEQNCTQSLKHFIKKQFPQQGSLSTSMIDDKMTQIEDDELSLVRTIDSKTHSKQLNELNRLCKLIKSCELSAVTEEVKESRYKAEVDEAAHSLERIKRGYYGELSQTSLHKQVVARFAHSKKGFFISHRLYGRQEIQSSQVQHRVASEEFCRQEGIVNDLVKQISERRTTDTLFADGLTKITRQEYYRDKQNIIQNCLIQQLSRQNLLSILLQCEAERVKLSFDLISETHSFLGDYHKQANMRTDYLHQLHGDNEKERLLGRLPSSLATLAKLMEVHEEPLSFNSTISTVINSTISTTERIKTHESLSKLLSERDDGLQHLSSQHHPYSYRINKLIGKCEWLEESLSGKGNHRLPGVLPTSWLSPDVIDLQNSVEGRTIDFQKAMMNLLLQYENKKMMVVAQPELSSQRQNWSNKKH